MRVDRIEINAALLRLAFYNVGIQQGMLNNLTKRKAENRLDRLATDIVDAFITHEIDLLGHLPISTPEIGRVYKMKSRTPCEKPEAPGGS